LVAGSAAKCSKPCQKNGQVVGSPPTHIGGLVAGPAANRASFVGRVMFVMIGILKRFAKAITELKCLGVDGD
jgi:hypothetical protein